MIRENGILALCHLSSLSSQTAKPCRRTWEFSKQTHIYKGKTLALCKYFDCHPPIIKAVRLRTTGLRTPVESLADCCLGGSEYMPETTPKSSVLSQTILSTGPCIFSSWWPIARPPEFLRLDLQMPSTLFECHPHPHACLLHPGSLPWP